MAENAPVVSLTSGVAGTAAASFQLRASISAYVGQKVPVGCPARLPPVFHIQKRCGPGATAPKRVGRVADLEAA
jgi:hypothetical protein